MNELLKKPLVTNAESLTWSAAWQHTRFRRMAIGGFVVCGSLLAIWPLYLAKIEARKGVLLNDFILKALPAYDVSIPVFICLWGAALLLIARVQRNPMIYLNFIWAYAFLFLSRIISIGLTPLEPPADLIELRDPLSNYFYGAKFITKDLFFSGHTASICLMAFCLLRPVDRWLVFFGSAVVGVGVLVQRVHYTADVVAAPFFAYAVYWLATRLTRDVLK